MAAWTDVLKPEYSGREESYFAGTMLFPGPGERVWKNQITVTGMCRHKSTFYIPLAEQ